MKLTAMLKVASLFLLVMSLAGCGLWQKQDVIKNRQFDYLTAKNYQPLQLPEGLVLVGAVPYAPIPPARTEATLTKKEVQRLLSPPDRLTSETQPDPNATESSDQAAAVAVEDAAQGDDISSEKSAESIGVDSPVAELIENT